MERQVFFREVQQFRQWWVWLILLATSFLLIGIFGNGMYQQLALGKTWGNKPLSDTALAIVGSLTILLSLGLIWLFWVARLITEVTPTTLSVRFIPFHTRPRTFPFDQLQSSDIVTYNAIRDYGGYGIRHGLKGRAYNASGNRGVSIELADGKKVLIGSQRPEELHEAITNARK